MRAWLACITLLAAFAIPLSAFAIDMPHYVPGQTFIFDNGRVERVQEVNENRVVWAARTGRTYVRDANVVVPILEWTYRGQRGRREIVGDPSTLWPLRAGAVAHFRSVNYTRDASDHVRRSLSLWTCRVRAPLRIEVPAGAFDTFPIVCDRYSPNSMRILERLTWHYAPDVGHYVQREGRDMVDGVGETYRLYAALPPRAANPARIEALAHQALEQSRLAHVGALDRTSLGQ